MKPVIKIMLFGFISSAGQVGFCGDTVQIRGYYQEDGTYIKPRVMDPIRKESEVLPALSKEIGLRKEQISKHYMGRVFVTKVSFPASHQGIVLYGDDLGRTDVDLFKSINKYGGGIDKGEKVVVTKFEIGRKLIDIELNDGGYGTLGDVTLRTLTGVLTLGLTELRDYSKLRNQSGSRLRIQLGRGHSSYVDGDDLHVEKFKEALKSDSPAGRLILENIPMDADQISSLNEQKLMRALEQVLAMPDFYQKVRAETLHLPQNALRLLDQAKKAAANKKPLKDVKIRTLNKEILCVLYPAGIRNVQKKFTAENLDFENINEYLSLVFERPPSSQPVNPVPGITKVTETQKALDSSLNFRDDLPGNDDTHPIQ